MRVGRDVLATIAGSILMMAGLNVWGVPRDLPLLQLVIGMILVACAVLVWRARW